jgi:hypothetical protein
VSESLCCALYDAFLQYIHAENLRPVIDGCHPDDCHAMKYVFINEFVDNINDIDETTQFLQWLSNEQNILQFNATHNVKYIANLLLLAYIGRHFTHNPEANEQTHPHFKYNFATNVVRAVHPHCMFERSVYLSMIVLTVVVLIFIILSRHIPSAWKIWNPRNDTGVEPTQRGQQSRSDVSSATKPLNSSFSTSTVIDFGTSNLRHR